MKKQYILIGILVIMAVCLFYSYNKKAKVINLPTLPSASVNDTYDIEKIRVINGNEYEITYKDSSETKLIHALLQVKTTEKSKEKVIKFLNGISQPKLVILNRLEGICIVDIIVLYENKNVSLADWLKNQGLVFE